NLPNYKIYLKLMIDGVTSRPFSAKTLPPLIKSHNHEIEEEVIKSSRELYCRPKEVIEKEINDWSGMMVGEDGNVTVPGEKFKAVCSSCGKETMVPFKPEPGRPVYCKDCIAKIKAGEMKPIRGTMNDIKYDESRYYKPLADLGIEFSEKAKPHRPVRPHAPTVPPVPRREKATQFKAPAAAKPSFFGGASRPATPYTPAAKPAPAPKPEKPRENVALREILHKTLSEKKILDVRPKAPPAPEPIKEEPGPEPVSLDALKKPAPQAEIKPASDRSASAESMNKLKEMIEEKALPPFFEPKPKSEPKPEPAPEPAPKVEEKISEPEPPKQEAPVQKEKPPEKPPLFGSASPAREVPEDVLRKILE
ncbi:MAG TPA: CxxC-x17-CxxC domain-containing protein, partial [Candidatus Paceibacterota bacterium]|nr:CxxC-x17-CxxC domain-containing protein [Candidatus Paceibacterota bacterium]